MRLNSLTPFVGFLIGVSLQALPAQAASISAVIEEISCHQTQYHVSTETGPWGQDLSGMPDISSRSHCSGGSGRVGGALGETFSQTSASTVTIIDPSISASMTYILRNYSTFSFIVHSLDGTGTGGVIPLTLDATLSGTYSATASKTGEATGRASGHIGGSLFIRDVYGQESITIGASVDTFSASFETAGATVHETISDTDQIIVGEAFDVRLTSYANVYTSAYNRDIYGRASADASAESIFNLTGFSLPAGYCLIGGGFDSCAGSLAPVPLPAGMPLLIAAFGGLGILRLRRQAG